MTSDGPLLPEVPPIRTVSSVGQTKSGAIPVAFTRDHAVIKRWAAARHAEPATGEATESGPATVTVNDGGAGIRFIFPGTSAFRPITWEEWLANFDLHHCLFVYDNESEEPRSSRYRIVRVDDWKPFLEEQDTARTL
jgi:hypothetical protein